MDQNNSNQDAKKQVEPLRIRKFEVGDLVFAKLKGYPPWPSKINQIESIISGGKEKTRYNVYFYGTHQSSILRSSSLYHYDSYAKSIVDKWGRKPKFLKALKELEREMMDKISYLHQLRTDSSWCSNFNSACEQLANDINSSNSTSQKKQGASTDVDEEEFDESRKIGYEVMAIEKIPFPNTQEALIILSLNFNPEWVKEEGKRLLEEERMMNCHVKIERFPPQYAHLDENNLKKESDLSLKKERDLPVKKVIDLSVQDEDEPLELRYGKLRTLRSAEKTFQSSRIKTVKAAVKTQRRAALRKEEQVLPVIGSAVKDISDGSDSEEAVETCPVCRLCFFSKTDLSDHERTIHGSVATAESLFDRLVTDNNPGTDTPEALPVKTNNTGNELPSSTYFLKEGYPLDSIIS